MAAKYYGKKKIGKVWSQRQNPKARF